MENDTHEQPTLIKASLIKRFANYIIDYIVVIVIVMFLLGSWDSLRAVLMADPESLKVRVIFVLIYSLIYVSIEGGLRGKTIGKLITRTRVVEFDGSEPGFDSFVVRSFCRIIPFEPFSFFFYDREGWHDRFSKTMVIDEMASQHLHKQK